MTLATEINTRVLKAVGLSLLLHGTVLAGWRTGTTVLPQLAAFEPIEVALLGEPAPRERLAPRPLPVAATQPRPAETAPVADTVAETTPATEPAGEAAASDEPLVEARSDVATLHNPKPPYPLAARRRGIEGRVLLTAHVRADGGCAEVQLKQSSGSSLLDNAALSTVRLWRFIPARRGDTALDSWVDVPVSFRLEG